MKTNKGPFGEYSVEDIFKAEASSYVIQVGVDLFDNNGQMIFSKKAAIMYYNKILNELMNVIDGGDDTERADAMRCLRTLHIMPLRIN